VPLGLPHAIRTENEHVGPYKIPQGHVLLGKFQSLLMGGAWTEGDVFFKPERFLGKDGSVQKDDKLIPFSVGKRMCPGEVLARAELFLFITGLLQSFRFEPENPDCLPSLDSKMGLTAFPLPFNVRVIKI
jgi:cytochrome P450